MLQIARLAPRHLGEAGERVERFLRGQLNEDGGFRDRSGASDLYYTVFGLEGLIALRADVPAAPVASYLRRFGEGEGLDFVHLTCLARAWSSLPEEQRDSVPAPAILAGVERHRSDDGGYAVSPGRDRGSAYGCFLALGAYQDLGAEMADPYAMLDCLEHLRARDGGYANVAGSAQGVTTATAAAVALSKQLGRAPDPSLASWLASRRHGDGGFFASPSTPVPDLLSTATALHALTILKADVEPLREPCLDFLDTLWSSEGAFYGHWADDALDCEYTYYGLLALGHLSL